MTQETLESMRNEPNKFTESEDTDEQASGTGDSGLSAWRLQSG